MAQDNHRHVIHPTKFESLPNEHIFRTDGRLQGGADRRSEVPALPGRPVALQGAGVRDHQLRASSSALPESQQLGHAERPPLQHARHFGQARQQEI